MLILGHVGSVGRHHKNLFSSSLVARPQMSPLKNCAHNASVVDGCTGRLTCNVILGIDGGDKGERFDGVRRDGTDGLPCLVIPLQTVVGRNS